MKRIVLLGAFVLSTFLRGGTPESLEPKSQPLYSSRMKSSSEPSTFAKIPGGRTNVSPRIVPPMERIKTDFSIASPDTASLTTLEEDRSPVSFVRNESETKREEERKLKHATPEEWAKKNARDAQLFWLTYDALLYFIRHEKEHGDSLQRVYSALRASTKENRNIFHAKRRLRFGKGEVEVTPSEALIGTWDSRPFSCRPKIDDLYRCDDVDFYKMLEGVIKDDRSDVSTIRILKCLVRSRWATSYNLMEQALLNKPDLLRCPDLIVECIEYWCVNREPIAKQHPVGTQSNIQSIEPKKQQRKSWFGRNKSKNSGSRLYIEMPESNPQASASTVTLSEMLKDLEKINFKKSEPVEQVWRLQVGRLLVNHGASLVRLGDDFPSANHAAQCLSCLYFRNCWLDACEGFASNNI